MTASETIDRLVERGERHCATCRHCIVKPDKPRPVTVCTQGLWDRPVLGLPAVATLPLKLAANCPDWRD